MSEYVVVITWEKPHTVGVDPKKCSRSIRIFISLTSHPRGTVNLLTGWAETSVCWLLEISVLKIRSFVKRAQITKLRNCIFERLTQIASTGRNGATFLLLSDCVLSSDTSKHRRRTGLRRSWGSSLCFCNTACKRGYKQLHHSMSQKGVFSHSPGEFLRSQF